MKAVFVESYNGYMAKSDTDDMRWTPVHDKKLFKLLSYAYGGVCICSAKTYSLLPENMKKDVNRRFIVAEREGKYSLPSLNKTFPSGVLIGGKTFLTAAYNLGVIDTFVVTTLNDSIVGTKAHQNPFREILTTPACEVMFPEMVVRVYYNKGVVK